MMIFQRALEAVIALVKRAYWELPRKLRLGSRRRARQAGDTGWASEGSMAAKTLRMRWGTAGAKSALPVCGLSQVPPELAFGSRKERSSRKKSSAFRPQRKLR